MTILTLAFAALGAAAGTVYVDALATGDGSGGDWENACTTLSNAVAKATGTGDEIHVKGDLSQTAVVTIASHAGLAIRGGYTGEDETTRSGRSRVVGDKTVGFRIFEVSASTITFDGLSIEQGFKNVNKEYGQGVQLLASCDAVFTNCCFVANGSNNAWGNGWVVYGGAIGQSGGTLTVVDCVFKDNALRYSANNFGGAGAGIFAGGQATVAIRNSTFSGNYTYSGWGNSPRGGALAFESCPSVDIVGCTFRTNHVYHDKRAGGIARGGALAVQSCTKVSVSDCGFFGNSQKSPYDDGSTYAQCGAGHAIYVDASTVALTRSVFVGQGAVGDGGNGVIDVSGSSARLFMTNVLMTAQPKGWCLGNAGGAIEAVNCTFTGTAPAAGTKKHPAYSQYAGSATFANCIFWDLADGLAYVREGATPTFANCSLDGTDPLFGDTTYCHPKSRVGRYDGGWFDGGAWVTADTETSTTIDMVPGFAALATEPQPNGRRPNCGYDGNTSVASKSDLDDDPRVDGVNLQVVAYPDYAVSGTDDMLVYGDVTGLGNGSSAHVWMVWDNADRGVTLANWAHKVDCGVHAPWDLASATMTGPSGTVYYRFYVENDADQIDWSAPARSFVVPGRPTPAYASPAVTHRYRASVRVNLLLADDGALSSTMSVTYWPSNETAAAVTVAVNGGDPVAVGTTAYAELTGLLPGVEYTYRGEATNAKGATAIEERTVTTVAADEPMTLNVAAEATGTGDGSSWTDATTIDNAFAQATAAGDVIRIRQGDYTLAAGLAVSGNPDLAIIGGCTGEGETRIGRSRLVRDTTMSCFHVLDISDSTVTVEGLSFEKGNVRTSGVFGQGVRVRDDSCVTFTNCLFRENGGTAWDNYPVYGGGIGADGGTLTILDCDFDGNILSRGDNFTPNGAGAYAYRSAVTVKNSRFNGNYAKAGWGGVARGGALAFKECANLLVDNCVFTTNIVTKPNVDSTIADGAMGGAISLLSCTGATISDCRIFGGAAVNKLTGGATGLYAQIGSGHGIHCQSSTAAILRTVISRVGEYSRSDVSEGQVSGSGAIDVYGGTVALTNVLMSSLGKGWAIGNHQGAIEAVNCTVYHTYRGGKTPDGARQYTAYSQYSGAATFANCIFWDLVSGVSFVKDGDEPTFDNCDLNVTDPLFGDGTYCHPMSRGGRYVGGYFSGGGFTTNDVVTSPTVDAVSGFVAAGLATEPQPNGCHVNLGYDGNSEVASKSDLGDDPAVDATKLQIFSYPDRTAESETDIRAYGTVASTGGSETDSVTMYLLWGDADEGEDESKWDHKENCGLCSPWETSSGTMRNVAGTAWYRFYAVNADRGTSAYSAPARSFALPSKPSLVYGDPALTHVYRRSFKVHFDLKTNSDLDTTVRVVYWPTQSPELEQTVYANFGQPCATGAVEIAVSGLTPGVEYTIRGEANSMMGTTTLEEQTLATVGDDEPLALNAAPAARGCGDGSSWEDAATLPDAFAQTTGAGDVLRLAEGEYEVKAGMEISGQENFAIVGGYSSDGTTCTGLSRLVRGGSYGDFRLFDISASTVTVSGVSIENGHRQINGEIGHGIKVSNHADVTITNCVFANNGGDFDNQWTEYGGALGAKDAVLRVVDCEFSDNCTKFANNYSGIGGALYAKDTSLAIVNSRFSRNYGHDGWGGATKGGAIALESCSGPEICGCTFNTNYVSKSSAVKDTAPAGGTLWMSGCAGAVIADCAVNGGFVRHRDSIDDLYAANGTVFKFVNSTASLLNVTIRGVGESGDAKNPSTSGNGVIDVEGGALAMTNVLMAGTTKSWGIGNKGGMVKAVNCTIAGISQNTGNRTYAAYVQNTSGAATFENTIYWDVPDGVAYTTGGNDVTNDYCAAETALEGKGNVVLASSPFTDAAAGDYTLNPTSRCANVGRNSAALRRMTDLEGNLRVRHGKVDLGAYESDSYRGFLLLVR